MVSHVDTVTISLGAPPLMKMNINLKDLIHALYINLRNLRNL